MISPFKTDFIISCSDRTIVYAHTSPFVAVYQNTYDIRLHCDSSTQLGESVTIPYQSPGMFPLHDCPPKHFQAANNASHYVATMFANMSSPRQSHQAHKTSKNLKCFRGALIPSLSPENSLVRIEYFCPCSCDTTNRFRAAPQGTSQILISSDDDDIPALLPVSDLTLD